MFRVLTDPQLDEQRFGITIIPVANVLPHEKQVAVIAALTEP
jgi:hypothetical protein